MINEQSLRRASTCCSFFENLLRRPMMMLRLLILFLIIVMTSAWVPVVSQFNSATALHAARDKDHDNMSRRRVLNSAFAALTFLPSASVAKSPIHLPSVHSAAELSSITLSYDTPSEDPLDSFGKELSGITSTAGNIPDTRNPTAVNSAASPPTYAPSSTGNASNLQQAIDESLKKKRIDPRTHG